MSSSNTRPTSNAPGSALARLGRSVSRYVPEDYNNYMRNMYSNLRNEYERHRRPATTDSPQPQPENSPIKVELVEFHAKNNAEEHKTDRYELVQFKPATPVFRRGNAFYIAIRFAGRKYDPSRDLINVVFNFGPRPNIAKGTKITLAVGSSDEFTRGKASWDVRVHSVQADALTLHIQIPATVCVGVWKCDFVTSLLADRNKKETFTCKENIYILFNPWCKEDSVFLNDEAKRQEYVLSDVGKVYVGAFNHPSSRRWVFGQFDDAVLPACMYILELSKLDFTARGNPVKVVRAISATVNSQDDNGIIVGRWDNHYDDGTAPWDWTGSLKILEDYMRGNGKPVMYGQCWVFSGVTTTICRALGIPCRSVTNFVSAHDTDESLTIDKFFDGAGNQVDEASNDSIWNFHVWNDVWMARPDLPMGYGGWQAVDATPQEQSEDVYQVGPASVEAVRRGEIGFLYDTPFVFSEVNADIIHWQEDNEQEIGFKKMRTNKYHVGRCILTKKCGVFDDTGDTDLEDVLNEYKNAEGTEDERLAVMNAARAGGVQHIYDMPTPEKEDVFFDLIDIDKISIGQPFNVNVKLHNKSAEKRTIFAVLSACSVYYTGVQAQRVKKVDQDFVLEPGQEELLSIKVNADEYLDKLVDYSLMKIYAIAVVKETRQAWTEEDDFAVEKPTLQLEVKGPIKVKQEFSLECSFTNPLNRVLQQCHFTFEGPGLTRPRIVNVRNVNANGTIRHVERFTPVGSGERIIVANFSSSYLGEVNSSKTIQVQE